MTRRDKREAAIRNNPENVRFDDLVSWIKSEGFWPDHQRGSHQFFCHCDFKGVLNLQNVKGMAKGYQVEQAIEAIDEVRVIARERERAKRKE